MALSFNTVTCTLAVGKEFKDCTNYFKCMNSNCVQCQNNYLQIWASFSIVTVRSVNSACNQAATLESLTNVWTRLMNLAVLSYTHRFLVQNHLPSLDITQTQKRLKLSCILKCSTLIRWLFLHVYVCVCIYVCLHLYGCMSMCVCVCVGQRLMQAFFQLISTLFSWGRLFCWIKSSPIWLG